MNNSVAEPRLRVNRTTAITLTTSWQDVIFNGTSTYNINTYGDDKNSVKTSWYDSTNNLFKFGGEYDRNITMQIYPRTTVASILTAGTLQLRFIIPNGGGAGIDIYFPFPDDGGYMDTGAITILSAGMNKVPILLGVYINNMIRTNGFKLQVKLSNSLAGTATLNTIALLIQSRN